MREIQFQTNGIENGVAPLQGLFSDIFSGLFGIIGDDFFAFGICRDAKSCVSTIYPETELSYLGNVTNALAAEFYRQHGVTEVEDGLEKSYSKQPGLKVMTTKHCIRYANGMCSRETGQKATPLILENEKGTFRLEFDCRNCQMNVISMA